MPLRAPPWPPGEFFVGANLPWVDYGCDFGASAWFPDGGLAARPRALAAYDRALERLTHDQVPIVRLFLLCDCRSGVLFDDGGVPVGLDDAFFRDADAAFDRAAAGGLEVMPVLFDFHVCNPPVVVNRVQLGGHSDLITAQPGRDALLSRVVRPIVERYGRHPAVAAWDLFNEPEWSVRGSGSLLNAPAVPFEDLRAALGELARVVQSCAPQPVTVGSASAAYLDLVTGLGLDFYQVHWYERFGWAALADSVDRFAQDKPVILGEFPGRTAGTTPAAIVSAARAAGYAGALIWSLLAEDRASGYETISLP